ncbi:inositol polyphosphate-5-phosphatase A-like isoform X1 [Myxocyprinus asiaticus]|uniref:inositol polyphosphate-5-phosphatase A-like isoform X1 n=1 Tax=Myxocyprinus asiaticus TaxID=70543 RepID=UPI002223A48A|nr:inositol polyphosphate-5-phosphatase A-like isoform X1 [Myxocyprinus asiaticus]XP_051525339.1 inositol polyphosphate-5-phosphatase A-like isoform X1 [Myxocyprinus asiaticus]
METYTDVLLVTANVGSLFDNVGEIEKDWLRELFTTVHRYKPCFVALHFQEVGGKDYMVNMGHAENFFWTVESSSEMKDFDRVCVYVDSHFKAVDSFTALGSMYFIHKSLKNIQQYDFNAKEFKTVSGHNMYVGSLEGVTTVEKEKFPKNFWPDFKWSRKGYMRTRWIIHNQGLDLVNVHLFHDASNLIACNSSPSVYSANREKAFRYVINRISESSYCPLPFFLFGDFNFRLDTLSLVQNLSMSADIQTVKKDSTNEVEKIICEEKDNDHKVLLQIETKLFAYLHEAVFRENDGKELLKYDKEMSAFHDVIAEEDIQFPPSYPYSEDYTKPTQYMNTRCPAWCDRILMSHSARDIIHRREEGESVVYNTLGSNVCMGDHKPVFLFFTMKTIAH